MRIDIVSKHENALLGRQEIEFEVKEAKLTPSRKEIREKIAAILGADEKKLVVDVFRTSYGTPLVMGSARIYRNEKDLKGAELDYVIARNFGKPEKPKAGEAEQKPAPKAGANK